MVAVLAVAARNLLRTRPGRALQAVRDRDQAAEVIGVSLVHWKVGAFVVSSGYAACAGAMYAAFSRYVSPLDWGLFLSISYVAMIVVGGIGSVAGSILGALFLTMLPRLVDAASGREIEVFKGGRQGKARLFHLSVEAAILTPGTFEIHQQSQAFFKSELDILGIGELLLETFAESWQAQLDQFVE